MDVLLRWKLKSRKGDFRREEWGDWEIACTGGRCVSPLGFWLIGLLSADVKACTLARYRTSNWFFMLSAENSSYWLIIHGNNSLVKREAVKLGHGWLQGYRRWILLVVWWFRARVATLGVQVWYNNGSNRWTWVIILILPIFRALIRSSNTHLNCYIFYSLDSHQYVSAAIAAFFRVMLREYKGINVSG